MQADSKISIFLNVMPFQYTPIYLQESYFLQILSNKKLKTCNDTIVNIRPFLQDILISL